MEANGIIFYTENTATEAVFLILKIIVIQLLKSSIQAARVACVLARRRLSPSAYCAHMSTNEKNEALRVTLHIDTADAASRTYPAPRRPRTRPSPRC